jgi:transposase
VGQIWRVPKVDGKGIPVGSLLESASPNENQLLERTLGHMLIGKKKIKKLVYDKACDSDPLRFRLKAQGIDLICPHRAKRRKKPTQDGRKLRRYRRRWIVERTFAWLGTFRRLIIRWDRSIASYSAFFNIACLIIALRRL